MKTLKDAYLSDLVELDQVSFIPKITKVIFFLFFITPEASFINIVSELN
jgi:hypothetical protein